MRHHRQVASPSPGCVPIAGGVTIARFVNIAKGRPYRQMRHHRQGAWPSSGSVTIAREVHRRQCASLSPGELPSQCGFHYRQVRGVRYASPSPGGVAVASWCHRRRQEASPGRRRHHRQAASQYHHSASLSPGSVRLSRKAKQPYYSRCKLCRRFCVIFRNITIIIVIISITIVGPIFALALVALECRRHRGN